MMICIELLENLTNQELALFSHIDNMIGIEQSQVQGLKTLQNSGLQTELFHV